ncbi:ABC transporter permease [Candidatus Sumerlaeota bacterium]|nr:ABC transporter permease [Candidatus Sumerlaeota bacterium]
MMRCLLIAWTVLIEAVRRREVYAIVLVSTLLIGALATTRFFDLQGVSKFYREVALQIMTIATNLTVIIVAARQLPREFESRTIYPLLAKPVSRFTFMLGKLLGVMGAGVFCFLLFMLVFLGGCWSLDVFVSPALFAQFLYLQVMGLLIVATLSFALSLLTNLDAAITMGALLYMLSSIFLGALTYLYQFSDEAVKVVLKVMVFVVPQLSLFDLSEKVVHQETWPPVPAHVVVELTAYSLVFSGIFFGIALMLFRRRAL